MTSKIFPMSDINDNTNLGTDEITVKREELGGYIALETNDWEEIYSFLKAKERIGQINVT